MSFEMDEMNRRRQDRQQRQKERLQQEKKTRTRLLIAAAVLLLCGILILAVSLRNPAGNAEEPIPKTTLPTQTTQPVQTQMQEAETVIHFVAAGDLNVTDAVVAAGGSQYDYTNAFMDVLPLLAEADLTAINFEGNACGVPYGKDSAPQQLLTALKGAGVDMLQLANSKAINRGVAGLNATVRNVRAAGMASVGAVAEGEAPGAYVIRYVRGVKVAIVAFTKGMDGMAMPAGSEELVNILYNDYASTYKSVNTKAVTKLLRQVESEEPDITIALLHWGSEYSDVHSSSQTAIRDLMFSQGVETIIGSHPHYVQEIVFDKEAGTLVAYSLGDFFGDATRSGTAYSIILELEITKDNTTGITKVTDFTYTPIYTVQDDAGLLRVVRLEEAISAYEEGRVGRVTEETYESMVYGLKRIEARIHPEDTTESTES